MLLLEATAIQKHFGEQEIFQIERLSIAQGARIGLVGRNGAGKSTLLRILSGESAPDSGAVQRRCKAAVIRQTGETDSGGSAHLKSLLGLRACACKSGGERTRLAIAAAFSAGTPLLFADEPTTNLDMEGVSTLQKLFMEYRGALVLVSHDRALLDAVCTQIWELEERKLRVFPGKYTQWQLQKQREREHAQFEYEQYRSEQARLTAEMREIRAQARGMRKPPRRMSSSEWTLYKDVAANQQRHMQSRAKQMEKRLAHMQVKERPHELPRISMPLGGPQTIRAKNAARIEHITVRFGDKTVLNDASLVLPAGSRTVLLGENGAGKTTLIQALLKQGQFADGVAVGYFAQGHETLDNHKTVLENACAASDLPAHVVRTILANLYLSAREMDRPAAVLSGGERAKVQLARLLAAKVHLLILDEPTNHLDIYTLEALETLLAAWRGTLLLVTHDRRMAAHTANRVAVISQGKISVFEGDMEAWEAEQARRSVPRDCGTERKSILELRMAALNARMSCPRKGDDPEALKREWEELLRQLRAL